MGSTAEASRSAAEIPAARELTQRGLDDETRQTEFQPQPVPRSAGPSVRLRQFPERGQAMTRPGFSDNSAHDRESATGKTHCARLDVCELKGRVPISRCRAGASLLLTGLRWMHVSFDVANKRTRRKNRCNCRKSTTPSPATLQKARDESKDHKS